MRIPFLTLPPGASRARSAGYAVGLVLATLRLLLGLVFIQAFFGPRQGDEWAPVVFMIDFPVGLLPFYATGLPHLPEGALAFWTRFCFVAGSALGIYWHLLWPQLIAILADKAFSRVAAWRRPPR